MTFMHAKIDQGTARAMNRRLVLDELRRTGPLSRTRLAERTRLSPAAITGVTGNLLAEGLLIEHPELAPHLPRNPVPLGINYTGHQTIGMKLLEHEVQAVLTDLALNVVARTTVPLASSSPEAVVEAAQRARDRLTAAQPDEGRLIGVGLGLPGQIDSERGVCVESYRVGWQGVPLGAMLRAELAVPVWIDNDVNAFATAERLVGRARQAANLVVVTLGRGVGAALVLGGRLYRGPRGAAGEFGHVLSESGGRVCECGLRGCLEAYVSGPNLVAQFNEGGGHPVSRVEELAALSARGEARATALLEAAGKRLGERLGDLACLFDPDLVIVGGEGVVVGEGLLGAMRRAFESRRFMRSAQAELIIDTWGDDAWARGAAGLVVEHFFEGFAPVPKGRADKVG